MTTETVMDGGAWASYKAALADLAQASERLSATLAEGSEAAEMAFQAALTAYHAARQRLREKDGG
jgi:hypothetical protein